MALRRRDLYVWHRRIGVAAAALIAVVTLTGILLVFRGALKEPLPRVAAATGAAPSLDAVVAAARAAGGGARATDITLPEEPGDPYQVWLDDEGETRVLLDGDGRVVEARSSKGGLTQWLFAVHTGEIVGAAGQGLSAAVGLGLLALVVSGLVMARRPRRAREEGRRASV